MSRRYRNPPVEEAACAYNGEACAGSVRRERLAARLAAAFEAEPLEDGMDRPAEEILAQALRRGPDPGVLQWIEAMSSDTRRPAFAASVLRCAGRLESPGTPAWRADVVRTALARADIEIRDAAAVAAEWWGGPGMRAVFDGSEIAVSCIMVRPEELRYYVEAAILNLESRLDWNGKGTIRAAAGEETSGGAHPEPGPAFAPAAAPSGMSMEETIAALRRERAGRPPVSAAEIRAARDRGRP